MVTTLKLRVAECKIKDAGKKKALLDTITMNKLGVTNGDIVEIVGKKITAVIVYALNDKTRKSSYINIDGQTRKNAGVGLNDYVMIKETNPKLAEKSFYYAIVLRIHQTNLFHILIQDLKAILLERVINSYLIF
ncbi:MAG: hypothetical protein H0X03_07740 [Nitrosopumilus sp.]|nr:hypothetical protein [Nitrosopumilus sp.]